MIFLSQISRKKYINSDIFPFSVPVIKSFETLELTKPVTFLVGENGSGKSTFIEAIAQAANSITLGAETFKDKKSLIPYRDLADSLRFSWKKRTHRGFFMRAEDFFNFSKNMKQIVNEIDKDIESYEERFSGYGLMLAKGSAENQRREITSRYGEDFSKNSHGESFIKLFQQRLVPDGLYLLDEPEAPLSPIRQIGLLSIIKDMVENNGCQFIIATHSPIIMAYPDSDIYAFDNSKIEKVEYNNLEHVNITRDFLNNPEMYLRHL